MSREYWGDAPASTKKDEPEKTINGVDIPKPTPDDLEWAKKAVKLSRDKCNEAFKEACNNAQLWRIDFLMNIERIDRPFYHKGISHYGYNPAFKQAIEDNNVPVIRLLAEKKPHFNVWDKMKVLKHGDLELVKFFIDKEHTSLRTSFSDGYNTYGAYKYAIQSKNMDLIKYIFEHENNVLKYGEDGLKEAQNVNSPEIYQYIKEELAKFNAKFEQADENAQKCLPAPKAEDDWEKLDDNTIINHKTSDDRKTSLSLIYNFETRQLTTVFERAAAVTSSSQNFRDIEAQAAIQKAQDELINKGGNPQAYNTLKAATVRAPSVKLSKSS